MTSRVYNSLVAILLLVTGWACPVHSSTLVADLDLDQVSITIDFNGESLLLFGAVSGGTASDIIVIFKGPDVPLALRKKERASGIWMNRQTIIWQNAPSFYHIFSNRTLDEVLSEEQQARLRLGAAHIGLRTGEAMLDKEKAKLWRNALTRNMTDRGLWQLNENYVSIIRGALFRAPVYLPANIVPGEYEVRVLHVQNNQLVAEDTTYISAVSYTHLTLPTT